MEAQSDSAESSPQADDGGRTLQAYALARGGLELWLRRGEQLGRAACWIAATAAAGPKRAAKWRRQVASSGSIDSPPQLG